MIRKRKKGRPIGETIGRILVGFDQQIFRTTPPVQELIAKAQPDRGVSGEDGSEFEVVFPEEKRPGPRRRPESSVSPEPPDDGADSKS